MIKIGFLTPERKREEFFEFQDPKKVLIRQKIIEFSEQFSDLKSEKFMFLFKQYEKTF